MAVLFQRDSFALKSGDIAKQTFVQTHLEYVFDNTIVKTTNIMNGLRWKAYMDFNYQINTPNQTGEGRKMFNFGFDARNYYAIFGNFIWAVRAAGDFSWGNQKDHLLFRRTGWQPLSQSLPGSAARAGPGIRVSVARPEPAWI